MFMATAFVESISTTDPARYESLSRWQRFRLLGAVLWSGLFVSPLGLRKWMNKHLDDSDVVNEEILRLGKTFPSLVATLITERDSYMVDLLRKSISVLEPRRVVAVVGAGHVSGMAALWGQTLPNLTALRQSSKAEKYSPYPTAVTDDMLKHVNSEGGTPAPQKAKAAQVGQVGGVENKQTGQSEPQMAPLVESASFRFAPGDWVLVRDPEGLFLKGRVLHRNLTLNEAWRAANPDTPARIAYLVETDCGDLVAAPIDTESCISRDDFRPRWLRAAAAARAVVSPVESPAGPS